MLFLHKFVGYTLMRVRVVAHYSCRMFAASLFCVSTVKSKPDLVP
jgi:hypothetical protein